MKIKFLSIIIAVSVIFFTFCFSAFSSNLLAGDVDSDGKVTAADARLVLRVSAQLDSFTDEQTLLADVDFNSKITAADARLVLRASARLETLSLPETSSEDAETQEQLTGEDNSKPADESETQTEDSEDRSYPDIINAYLSGSFYMKGEIFYDDSSSEITIATNKNKTEITAAEFYGLTFYSQGSSLYLKFKYNNTKYWINLDSLLGMVDDNSDDFDISKITSQLLYGSVDNFDGPVITNDSIDKVQYTVYSFTDTNSDMIRFYADENDEIRYIFTLSNNTSISNKIIVNELSDKIPNDMLTLNGYKEGNVLMLMMLIESAQG